MNRDHNRSQEPGASWLWRGYVAAWMVLAGLALSYLILAASSPQFARSLFAIAQGPDATERAETETVSIDDVKVLRDAVAKLDARVAEVQTTVTQQGQVVADVANKVSGPVPVAAPDPPPIVMSRVRTVDTTTKEQPDPPPQARRGNLPPLPTRIRRTPRTVAQLPTTTASLGRRGPAATVRPQVINRTPPEVATTGSPSDRAKPPEQRTAPPKQTSSIRFGAPIVRPAGARTAVMLSQATSLDGLRVSWEQLVSQNPALLGGLQPRYIREPNGTYRLMAGPLDDRVMADRLCDALRTGQVPCGVGAYTGNAL